LNIRVLTFAAILTLLDLAGCAAEQPPPTKPLPTAGGSAPTAAASDSQTIVPATPPPTAASGPPSVAASATASTAPSYARSDDCAGDDLKSGKCKCAHVTCMDICCPEGWACAHHAGPDEGWSKCVSVPKP